MWLLTLLGLDGSKGTDFWGGLGSVLFTLLPLLSAYFYHHNCHVKGCWRLGKHVVNGTPYVVCRKHHPDIGEAPSAEDVAKAAN